MPRSRARRLWSLLLGSVLVATTVVRPVQAEEIYVPDDFGTIQLAIDVSSAGDVILVRPGTYIETIDFKGKAITVQSVEGPEVTTIDRAGGDDTVAIFRNFEGRDSILDGFELREGTGNCDLFFCYGGGIFCVDASPTIRNCIVRDNATTFDGGGMYVRRGAPLLENCRFEGNVAKWYQGGAIYIDDGSIEIRGCRFIGNSCNGGGGGILAKFATVLIEDSEFTANVAGGNGGGVDLTGGSTTIRRTLFDFNRCDTRGGGIRHGGGPLLVEDCRLAFNDARGDGGGIHCKDGDLRILGCEVTGNVAYGKGGGIHADGGERLLIEGCRVLNNTCEVSDGGGLLVADVPVEIRSCEFSNNEAHKGGAVHAYGASGPIFVVGSTFTRNRAVLGNGGALELSSGPIDIVNSGFFLNETVDNGGAVKANQIEDLVVANCVFVGNQAYWNGGALDVHQGLHRIVNCTVLDNETYSAGGGIYGNVNGLVANCIVRGNHAMRWPDVSNRDEGWEIDLRWSNVGEWRGEAVGAVVGRSGVADRLGPDRMVGTGDEDLRATACLAGIDAGDATLMPADRADVDRDGDVLEPIPLDYHGQPRFFDDPSVPDGTELPGAAVDLGASEWQGDGPPCDVVVDCDGNGVADLLDIANCVGDPGCLDCNGNGRPDRCDIVDAPPPFEPGIGFWRFDGDATDLGRAGIEGELQGDAVFTADRAVDVVPGLRGAPNLGAIEIGETGFVRIRDRDHQSFVMGHTDFTIEAWVRLDELGGLGDPSRRQYLVQRKPGDSGGSSMDYAFLVQGGNLPQGVDRRYGKASGLSGRELVVQFGENGSTWCVTSFLEVESTGWHHVSVSVDGDLNIFRFGLDGEFEEIPLNDGITRFGPEANLIIGAHTNSSGQFNQRLRGAIDELRIVRRVLSPGEMLDAWPAGTSADCNDNGRPDDCDIADGLLVDVDGDLLPDECAIGGCPADLDGDGVVGGADLGLLFVAWSGSGPADLDGDGVVGGADLGLLFVQWGDCPAGCGPASCDDEDECTFDGCHPVTGACTHVRIPGCVSDPCFGVVCDDGDDCTTDECDPSTGQCVHVPIPGCEPDPCEGVECDDGDPCTKDTCDSTTGACVFEPIEGCEPPACGDPAAGSCFVANGTPNCDDLACCESVCIADDFCCTAAWDETCVELAASLCP